VGELLILAPQQLPVSGDRPRSAMPITVWGVGKAGLEFNRPTGDGIDVKKEWPHVRPNGRDWIEREPKSYARFHRNTDAQPGAPATTGCARAVTFPERQKNTYFRNPWHQPNPAASGGSVLEWLHPDLK